MFPSLLVLGLAFCLACGPLTITATDGAARGGAGPRGRSPPHGCTAFQFGAALGLTAATAVSTAATHAAAPAALLDGYRAGQVVPFVAAALDALISAFGLRRRTGGTRHDGTRLDGTRPDPTEAAPEAVDIPRAVDIPGTPASR
ncbi:hypothetical protein ACM01_36965 [Streptomyces viridochromogenes]|uniref:Lipoprotein n=1 Tax=Streptomyces viridochromogenes TaxID=1938 RepID=A0A0J7Z013_STRVR|nr:hypothetical protein ACM01_36965 [Streptomyces viridochromogenes]KOG16112.1 hypothetical protein ADK36_28030 [Streptomyces viridochromogenes]KOG16381.1 hypothetical protein ADK35_27145 [Streptomyces viridochromogenes]